MVKKNSSHIIQTVITYDITYDIKKFTESITWLEKQQLYMQKSLTMR